MEVQSECGVGDDISVSNVLVDPLAAIFPAIRAPFSYLPCDLGLAVLYSSSSSPKVCLQDMLARHLKFFF
jgi:hypothetical protein